MTNVLNGRGNIRHRDILIRSIDIVILYRKVMSIIIIGGNAYMDRICIVCK